MKKLLVLFALIFIPAAAAASDVAGHDLLIPIAGRTPGALGSNWRTDLYVTNAERRSTSAPDSVSIMFGNQIITARISPRSTIVLKDIMLAGYGKETAVGSIRIISQSPEAKITARARIYNTGSAQGEFGQTVPALPVSKLARENWLPGLSGVNGNRTNVGISNPSTSASPVFVSLYDDDGELRGGFSIVVEPRSLYLLNDIFDHFQTGPLDNATLQITSQHGVYAYASVVRSDTGDSDFVAGTGIGIDGSGAVIPPACANPAPLLLATIPAKGWIVLFHPGTDAAATTATLAARYGFTPISIYQDALQGFHAELTPAFVASLRCESVVRAIEQNAQVPLP